MKTRMVAAAIAAMLLAAGGGAMADMMMVPVGDAGNAADTRYATPGYGAVSYSYNIGKYEVTAGQYTEFLNAVAATDKYNLYALTMVTNAFGCKIQQAGPSGSYTYSVPADYANRPVNFVSWGDSARFANWLSNGKPIGAQDATTTEDGAYALNGATTDAALLIVTREADWTWAISSEDEWYKAAYYKAGSLNAGYWDYATSTNTSPGRDPTEATKPGNNANYYGATAVQPPYYVTEAGEFELSRSPYGTFDQGGNVFEVNESVVGTARSRRGGCASSYIAPSGDNDLLASNRASTTLPTSESYKNGFRVVSVPEPATMALLGLGALALLRRRRAV